MEKNKLYLSIGHIMDGFLQSNIRIKLHNDKCYFRSRYHIDITPFASDFRNTNYLENASILAIHINDLLKNKINKFGGPYSADEFNMIPVVALRITERFMSNSEEFSMYDITDLENVYRVCPDDRYVDYCNEEDDEDDEEKNYIIPMLDRMDDLQDQIYDLENRLDDEVLTAGSQISLLNKSVDRLENEVFPNNELTARAQIKETNKRIDHLEQKINDLELRNRLMTSNLYEAALKCLDLDC